MTRRITTVKKQEFEVHFAKNRKLNCFEKIVGRNHCNVNRMRSSVPSVLSSSFFTNSSLSENVLKCRLVFNLFFNPVVVQSDNWTSSSASSLLRLEFQFCCTLIHLVHSTSAIRLHDLRTSSQRILHLCLSCLLSPHVHCQTSEPNGAWALPHAQCPSKNRLTTHAEVGTAHLQTNPQRSCQTP